MFKRALFVNLFCIPWILSCQTHASQTQRKDDESNSTETSSSKSLDHFTKDAEISLEYQKAWYDLLKRESCDESWALFSQGGFTNRGQTIVIRSQNDFLIYVENDDSTKKTLLPKQKLTSEQVRISAFKKVTSSTYKDFVPKAFDALKREYVYVPCSKLNQESFEPKRIKIIHTAKPKVPEDLLELISTFERLREIEN